MAAAVRAGPGAWDLVVRLIQPGVLRHSGELVAVAVFMGVAIVTAQIVRLLGVTP